MFRLLFLLLSIFLGLTHGAWASDTDLERFLSKATEVATSSGINIDQIPSSFTILDRHMIARSGAVTIAELLRFVPGLEVIREGNGSYHLIIRGNYSDRRVLILWDGQPLNFLLTRRALSFIGYLPVDILERVEISRGPSSAIYGSYAVGGVVNLVPRRWQKGGEVGGVLGAYDSARGFVSAGLEEEERSFQFSAGRATTNGDRLHVKDAVGLPGKVDLNYDVDWQELRTRLHNFSARFFRFHIENSHYYEITDRLKRISGQENDHTFIGGRFSYNFFFSNKIQAQAYLNWRQDILDYGKLYVFHPSNLEPLPLPPSNNPTIAKEKARLRELIYGFWIARPFGKHKLKLGFETMENSIRSAKLYGNRLLCSRDNPQYCLYPTTRTVRLQDPWPQVTERMWAIYLQDQWSLSARDSINIGLRLDKYNNFSKELSPRLVWTHRFNYKLVSKLIYGHGFRIPDLASLYDNHYPLISGNPDLDPEKLDSLEGVLIFKPTPRQRLSLSIFRMWLRDVLGRRNPGGIGGWSFQQGGDEDVWGGEVSYRFQGKQWDIYLFGSYQWGENEFDEPRPYVANFLAGGVISYSSPKWPLELNISWNYVGPRWREKYNPTRQGGYIRDNRSKLDEYCTINMKLSYKLSPNTSLWLSVTNLFEADIRYPSAYGGVKDDYQEQGRYWEIGIRYQF